HSDLLLFYSAPALLPLPSFPTRRSSDLFLTSAATLLAGGIARAAPSAPAEFIDTNVSLGQWPVRHTPYGEPGALVKKSRQHGVRSEEHTSELQSLTNLVCRLLLEQKKNN